MRTASAPGACRKPNTPRSAKRSADHARARLGRSLWPRRSFLAVTGWRRGEMLALGWSEVDLVTRTARLKDTKTGASLRPLSHAACDVLRALPRLGELVFPASVGADRPMRGFHKVWLRIAKRAALAPT